MNLMNQIKNVSQKLAQATDPEIIEELEVELADLEAELEALEDEENERYGWS